MPSRQAWKSSLLAQRVNTKYLSVPSTGRSSWKPSKPLEPSTIPARAAKRSSRWAPAPSGMDNTLIATYDICLAPRLLGRNGLYARRRCDSLPRGRKRNGGGDAVLTAIGVVLFVLLLVFSVAVHEFGHLLTAK